MGGYVLGAFLVALLVDGGGFEAVEFLEVVVPAGAHFLGVVLPAEEGGVEGEGGGVVGGGEFGPGGGAGGVGGYFGHFWGVLLLFFWGPPVFWGRLGLV